MVTPKVIRARKIQGQYLGALRALAAADKAKVKAVAKEKGVAAAVKMAKGLKKAWARASRRRRRPHHAQRPGCRSR